MKNGRFLGLVFLVILSSMTKSFAKPFGSLMMPVEFTIENGDFTNSTLNIKKEEIGRASCRERV